MKQNDKELKRALEAIYQVQPSEDFVYSTQQRLPSRGIKLLWLVLGNVAIWGTVAILGYLYHSEILQAVKSALEMMEGKILPTSSVLTPLLLCAIVLYTAIVHSVEIMEGFYRLLIEKRLESINNPK